jgi:hypothetical protein
MGKIDGKISHLNQPHEKYAKLGKISTTINSIKY